MTDQSSEYPGFEEEIEYTLVWRVGAGDGSEPELSAETEMEGQENDEVSFTPDATPNSGGELRFRMISTLWELSGATLDAETGEFHWVPGFADAGDRQFVLVATEYPTGLPENHVGWSSFLVIDMRIDNVNQPPVISERPDITVEYGAFVTAAFDIFDPDRDDIEVVALLNEGALPASVRWKNGRFIWTPGVEHSGENTLEITATEVGDPESYCQFSMLITVVEPSAQNILPWVWKPSITSNSDETNPRWDFRAMFEDGDVGASAQWWQVQISTTDEFGEYDIVWDSGQLTGSATSFGDELRCAYGAGLAWDTTHFWRIRACDNDDGVSPWAVGASFKTPVEPPAEIRTLSALALDASEEQPQGMPYENVEVQVSGEVGFAVPFSLSEGDQVSVRMIRDGDVELRIQLWQVVDETTGILRVDQAWTVEDPSNLERRLAFMAKASAVHVLSVYYYDPEASGETNLEVYINVAPRPPISPNEKRIGDLGNEAPEGLDHTAPKLDPEYGSDPLWREPITAPPNSNPPASDCRWRVNIQFLDEVREESEVFVKLKNGAQEVPDVYIDNKRVSYQDTLRYQRRAVGGFASSLASATANSVSDTQKVKYPDGAAAPDQVEVRARRVDGMWVMTATWLGSCGQPVVHVHAFSSLTVGLSIRAKGPSRKFKDVEQFDVSGAVKRRIFCPQVAVDVDTKLALGLKKDKSDGPFQIPDIPTDAVDAATRGANFILQEALNEEGDMLYALTSPEDEGAWDEDCGEAVTASAIAKVKAHSGSQAMVGRTTFFAGWGTIWNNYNNATARPRTSEMVIAISLICESSATEDCVGDIVRILYEIGPTPEGDAHPGSQDVRIEKNPSDPNKSGTITAVPTPLKRKAPSGDGPSVNETEVEVKGEETP